MHMKKTHTGTDIVAHITHKNKHTNTKTQKKNNEHKNTKNKHTNTQTHKRTNTQTQKHR